MKKIVLAALLAFPMLAFADSVVFGLEMGKATIEELTGRYNTKKLGINKYTKGEMYSMKVDKNPKKGELKLTSAVAVFSQDGNLVAILVNLPASEYNFAFETALDNFTIVPNPHKFGTFEWMLEDQSMSADQAKFIDGNTQIMLFRKKFGKKMEMNFVQKDVWQSFREDQKKQLEARERRLNGEPPAHRQ